MTGAQLIICADDYGISRATSAAVCDLLESGAINATTCLVESQAWPLTAPLLRRLIDSSRPKIAVGLHMNITEHLPFCSVPDALAPLPLTILRSLSPTRQFADDVYAALESQWNIFEHTLGQAPHFIDGHRHIHLIPLVRRALFRLLAAKRFCGWVRHCRTSGRRKTSKIVLLNAMSGPFVSDAILRGIAISPGFGGIRKFTVAEDVLALWHHDISQMRFGGVLMVHPGAKCESGWSDPIERFRVEEYELLKRAPLREVALCAGLTIAENPARCWTARSAERH